MSLTILLSFNKYKQDIERGTLLKKIGYKIITAGDGAVGKTTLLHRYVENTFLYDTKMTIGVGFFQKKIIVNDYEVSLTLWDFGGQDQFRPFLDSYVSGASGAILMFDLTRLDTLNRIDEWVKIIRKEDKNIPIIFVGGKLDLISSDSVDDDLLYRLKEKYHFFEYIKTSSKTGDNVSKVFSLLTEEVMCEKNLV